MSPTLLIVIAITVVALAFGTDAWRRLRRVEKIFANRPSLNAEQFYKQYFEQKGIPFYIIDGVRSVLEEQLSVDLSRLTDKDDFSKNLRFFLDTDSLADVEIVCALEKRFNITISDTEAQNTHTISDIVELVYEKVGRND